MPTKVLVLHGYSQNGVIFSKRIGALRKECKGVEFVFADAPQILQPADFVWNQERSSSNGASTSDDATAGLKAEVQGNEAVMQAEQDPSLTPRAWWKPNPERTMAYGIRESFESLKGVLQANRFDGVFGFSQGAAFAAALCAGLEKPHTHPEFLVNGQPVHPPFQFCLAVSGFKVQDPYLDPLWEGGYNTPTMHVLGLTDVVVVNARSKILAEVANHLRVEEHVGGHFVPTKGPWRKFLAAYLQNPEGQHAAPGAAETGASPSAPSSAANSIPGSRSETPTVPGDSAQRMKL